MTLIDILTVLAPTTIVTGVFTYFIAKRKETRADIDQLINLFKVDNERLREEERKLSDLIKLQSEKIQDLELRVTRLYTKVLLLESAQNDLPLPIWFKDEDGTFLSGNTPFEKHILNSYGMSLEAILGKNINECIPKHLLEMYIKGDKQALTHGIAEILIPIKSKTTGLITKWRIIKYARKLNNTLLGIGEIAIPVEHNTLTV